MRKVVVGLMVLALASTASAAIWSEGFEAGTAGWTPAPELNSGIFGPGGPYEGSNYASLQTGGTDAQESYFTSITVAPSSTVTLTGVVAGGVLNPQAPRDLYVQLIDGSSSSDTVVAEWRVTLPATVGIGWTQFGPLTGHIASGHVKVKFGHTGGAWASATAIHVDALNLTPEPASMALLGLAGLPLLRRRRRA